MKKTILTIVCASVLLTGVANASPLADYSAGKVAIDLSYSKGNMDAGGHGWNDNLDGKSTWDFSGTIGLGNEFAFQYSQTSPRSTNAYDTLGDYYFSQKPDIKGFNVMYQLDPYLSVYTGLVKAKGNYYSMEWGGDYVTDTRNIWQIGLTGSKKIADKLTGFASVGAGSGWKAYNIGLGYEVIRNVEVNVVYDYKKVKNLVEPDDDIYDLKVKGMKYGITYKF